MERNRSEDDAGVGHATILAFHSSQDKMSGYNNPSVFCSLQTCPV
jgi:hypothetical protein